MSPESNAKAPAPTDPHRRRATTFLHERFVFDIHGHAPGLYPGFVRLVRPKVPKDVRLGDFGRLGLSGALVTVLGDARAVYRFSLSERRYVRQHLRRLHDAIAAAGLIHVRDADGLRAVATRGEVGIVVGVEGGDFLGDADDAPEALDALYADGVRLLQLVHFSHNALGSVGHAYSRRGRYRTRPRGLTPLGAAVLERCNDLGLLVDLSHADEPTLLGAAERSRAPLLVSHTGARALDTGFGRYLSDAALEVVKKAGGLVGLWPMWEEGTGGMEDEAAFSRHVEHLLAVVGPDRLALGTDFNGVPSYMRGYRDVRDFDLLVAALFRAGLDDVAVAKVCGQNFARVFAAAEQARAPATRP